MSVEVGVVRMKTGNVDDAMPGENAPTLYPNCHCITASHWDREEFDRYIMATLI